MIDRPASTLSRRRALGALGSFAACGLWGPSALAASSSASTWSDASHSRLRLIRASGGKAGRYQAGIVIDMVQGYKTYWRNPGDSGVPPVFRFTGSQNLAEAKVHYPAPKRFADGAGGFSIGYKGPEVILPITVQALNPAEPVALWLEADYAVCEKLCVPAHGKASLNLFDAPASIFDEALKRAVEQVPLSAKLGANAPLAIRDLKRGTAPEHFFVETTLPPGSKPELFIEGGSPWFFDVKPVEGNRFPVLVVEKDKSPDCTGADITLTLVSAGRGIEVSTRLDIGLIAS
jgi:DsbC/DsbD-like thiol-disulfide interchange protein